MRTVGVRDSKRSDVGVAGAFPDEIIRRRSPICALLNQLVGSVCGHGACLDGNDGSHHGAQRESAVSAL